MSISINEPIGAGEGVIKKRQRRDFFVYERVNGSEWRYRAKKFVADAGSACDQWYASLGTRARQAVHFVAVTGVSPKHNRRKTVSTSFMRDRFCYLFVGYGPGRILSFGRRRRQERTSPAVSEWITL